ncbi:hypothetical protein CDAR_167911 [Caerostris darwini]|uniref:Uncharacterized protein n=1 Tax=Caerostris darwini TaxID=1538125 RepID=A0AAV4VJ14_9ARAC|nr:hypothetical protein CDAR_167911 [Caerostris darwini]
MKAQQETLGISMDGECACYNEVKNMRAHSQKQISLCPPFQLYQTKQHQFFSFFRECNPNNDVLTLDCIVTLQPTFKPDAPIAPITSFHQANQKKEMQTAHMTSFLQPISGKTHA